MFHNPFSTFRAILYLIVIDQLRRNAFSAFRTTVCPLPVHDPPGPLMCSVICNLFLQILRLRIYDLLYCRLCLLMQALLYLYGKYLDIVNCRVQRIPVFNISLHCCSSCPSLQIPNLLNLKCLAVMTFILKLSTFFYRLLLFSSIPYYNIVKNTERNQLYMKQLLKKILKKLFKFFYGTQEDIIFKFSLAVLTTGVALLILSFLYSDNPAIFTTLSYLSTLSFIVWILTTKGFNAVPHYTFELLRLILYPVAFTWAVNTFINNSKYTGFWLCFYIVLASVCFLLCFIYFIVKLFDILAFFKKVFVFIT